MLRSEGQPAPGYDVVVVGSGYGGAIAASRFARAGRSVCVLERGAERWPGDFPETATAFARNSQINTVKRRWGSPLGLYDFRLDDEVNVLVGCGLGGTSLINANVALRPRPDVFDDERWPTVFRGANKHLLDPYFARAEAWLGSNATPADGPRLAKFDALQLVAEHLDAPIRRAPVNVTFADGTNPAGVSQQACNNCGNCVAGCNVGAKNTVLMNYLPDAAHHGAEMFTERSVQWVEPSVRGDRRWRVAFDEVGGGRFTFDAPHQFVDADIVVLAAGTLGSTEIMLRSRDHGLTMSDRVGDRFNGNGDVLGFGYDSDHDLNAIGWGPGERRPPVGPTITGVVPVRRTFDGDDGHDGAPDLVIEEGAIPGALGPLMPLALLWTALSAGKAPWRKKLQMLRGSWKRAARHTLTYLVMSNDQSDGRLVMQNDRITIDWPGGPNDAHIRRNNSVLEEVSPAIGADYAPEMWWTEAMGHQLVTVHPLGGCVMADDAATGVVNDRCEVFSAATGDATHRGLHVMDGAVVARPVDTNPSLTISALVERAVELTIADHGWPLDLAPTTEPVDPAHDVSPVRPGLSFTERMVGTFRPVEPGSADSPFSFVVTIDIDDLADLQGAPDAIQPFVGTMSAPALSPDPLTVHDGEFQLLQRNMDRAEEWRMHYRCTLAASDGRRFGFVGHKSIRTGSMWRGWADTTTLFIEVQPLTVPVTGGSATNEPVTKEPVTNEPVTKGSDPEVTGVGAPGWSGVLRISIPDFARQLWTIDSPGSGFVERQRRKLLLGRAFTGAFLPVYGGLFAEEFRADHQPFEGLRALRLPRPTGRWFAPSTGWTAVPDDAVDELALTGPEHLRRHRTPLLQAAPDDAELLLTRFDGGSKGPVLLAAGFSMRANSFAEPTTDTTLAEALCAAGFDVWLFDYRASIALPSSSTAFTIDDVARLDWPRAVAEVRRATGADEVQVVGHCVGSVSILMALLSGLEGVSTAVCSQFPLHPVTGPLNRFKNAIRAVDLFQMVGIRRLEPSTGRRLKDRFTDLAGAVLPIPRGERCQLPMCRWLNSIFGLTHTHDQINAATHESFTAAFGVGEVRPLRHLSTMLRHGRAVDADGNDTYLPNVDKLGLPLLFIQGSKNYIFRPAGTAKTVGWLRDHHDPALFDVLHLDGYAHLDGIVGTNAARDVYPAIIEHLERHAPAQR